MSDFDLLIIGGGPGGYVAAIRAAQLGLKTALVERENLGGICLNWGCIPTKALLRSAEVYHLIQNAESFGINLGSLDASSGVKIDLQKIVQRSRAVAEQLSKGVTHLLKKNKVTVIKGTATLMGNMQVSVVPSTEISVQTDKKIVANSNVSTCTSSGAAQTYKAKNIIIATGAHARPLAHIKNDREYIVTYREAMVPQKLPKSLLVLGSGAIGIEFASFYRTLGAEVTVVELQEQILPQEDQEIAGIARKIFEKQGIKIFTGSTVSKASVVNGEVNATIEDPKSKTEQNIKVDQMIIATGILANIDKLGLENTKIKLNRGHIVTNQYCETDEPGIYAIGDVAGPPWLAHKASHEGILCVDHLSKQKNVHGLNRLNIPGCTYSLPQIASVGMTEAQAKAQGHSVKIGRFPYAANGKAVALGEKEGLIKTIFDANTGELLGAHMIGAEVTELIQGFTIAKNLETTEQELMNTVFPHPTLSEMMHEAVLNAYDRTIHC